MVVKSSLSIWWSVDGGFARFESDFRRISKIRSSECVTDTPFCHGTIPARFVHHHTNKALGWKDWTFNGSRTILDILRIPSVTFAVGTHFNTHPAVDRDMGNTNRTVGVNSTHERKEFSKRTYKPSKYFFCMQTKTVIFSLASHSSHHHRLLSYISLRKKVPNLAFRVTSFADHADPIWS